MTWVVKKCGGSPQLKDLELMYSKSCRRNGSRRNERAIHRMSQNTSLGALQMICADFQTSGEACCHREGGKRAQPLAAQNL